MKKKNGFTLIELLAVIIILGVLMIIAVPAVTKYINDSRKNGYVSTAKELAGSARNLVYSGSLDLDDKNTTYYVDGECLKTENAYRSPFGEFESAYVAVTATDNNHEYYWFSVDDSGVGVRNLTSAEKLEIDNIEEGIDKNDISPNIGIDKRKNIVIYSGKECTKSIGQVDKTLNTKTGKTRDACPEVTPTIYWAISNNKLTISDSEVSGTRMGNFSGDSIFDTGAPWNKNADRYTINEVKIVGTVVPLSTKTWFDGTGDSASTFTVDLSNLEMCNVSDMSKMFIQAGRSAATYSLNLGDWDTSNVTDMSSVFEESGQSASSWTITGIDNWDTSNVTNMARIFYSVGLNDEDFNLNLSNWDTSNVSSLYYSFHWAGASATSFNLNLSNWDLSSITDMRFMFRDNGSEATTCNINLSNWNTKNITDMSSLFSNICYSATNFNLNISNWDTSNVTNMYEMIKNAGANSTSYNVIIPKTNGNTLNNTTTALYGKTASVVGTPPSGKQFTLAS